MQEDCKLHGICCEVESCVFNNGSCCCTAKNITVKPKISSDCEITMCETFEQA